MVGSMPEQTLLQNARSLDQTRHLFEAGFRRHKATRPAVRAAGPLRRFAEL